MSYVVVGQDQVHLYGSHHSVVHPAKEFIILLTKMEMDKESAKEIAERIKALLRESSADDARGDARRLDELRRLFAKLIQDGELQFSVKGSTLRVADESNSGNLAAFRKWREFLLRSHRRMIEQLTVRIAQRKKQLGGQAKCRSAIRTLWGVIAQSPVTSGNGKYQILNAELVLLWVRAMTNNSVASLDNDSAVRQMVQAEFLDPYRDAQYYVLSAIATCAEEIYASASAAKNVNGADVEIDRETSSQYIAYRSQVLMQLLSMISIPPSQKDFDSTADYLFPPQPDEGDDIELINREMAKDDGSADDGDDDSSAVTDTDSDIDSDESSSSDQEEPKRPTKRRRKVTGANKFNFQLVRMHRRVFAKAWLAVLKLPSLPQSSLKLALQLIPENVLPHVPNPLLFSDFFMTAYDGERITNEDLGVSGDSLPVPVGCSVIPVLALSGLFVLMTKHGLEYPNFYKQLYRLISPRLMSVRFRSRFFRLLDKCLTQNEMLPAHVVAAFIKRMCRCSLSAPPGAVMFILALSSNLIRKHPETACLIHRLPTENGTTKWEDKFDAVTDDPEDSLALQSSLWELNALERHYYSPVVILAKSIGSGGELTMPLHNLEDFLSQTYSNAFEQERKRKQKRATPLTFRKPESLFDGNDIMSSIIDYS